MVKEYKYIKRIPREEIHGVFTYKIPDNTGLLRAKISM
jgi:hypothetical protein